MFVMEYLGSIGEWVALLSTFEIIIGIMSTGNNTHWSSEGLFEVMCFKTSSNLTCNET